MKNPFFSRCLLVLAGLLALGTPLRAAEEIYAIDKVHSSVEFKVRHLGISSVTGNFRDFAGTIKLDPAKPESSSVEVTVQAASVDTGTAKRDEHLRTADFFNVEKFPTLSFKSTAVKKTGANTYGVTGDFTLLGVTKPVTITVTDLGSAPGMKEGELRHGGETQFTIKRSDYGMAKMVGPISDEIQISLAFSGIKQ